MEAESINKRVALVTGGGRGIGREAALLLAAAGARVMIAARSESELAAVGLEYVVADLGTTEGCGLAVAETERRLGPIDLLVVNHGIGSAHERLVWEQDPEVWRETMRINLDGPFELARLTVGGMCKRGFGRWYSPVRPPARKRNARAARTRHPSTASSGSRGRSLRTPGLSASLRTRCCRVGCEPRWPSARLKRKPNGVASASRKSRRPCSRRQFLLSIHRYLFHFAAQRLPDRYQLTIRPNVVEVRIPLDYHTH